MRGTRNRADEGITRIVEGVAAARLCTKEGLQELGDLLLDAWQCDDWDLVKYIGHQLKRRTTP